MSRQRVKGILSGEAYRLFAPVLEAGTCGVFISDSSQSDNPIVFVNPAFEALSGFKQSEVLGRNCWLLLGDDKEQAEVEYLRAAIEKGKHCKQVLRNYRKDGSLFWCELSLTPSRDECGNLTYYVGVLHDVTAQIQVKAQNEAYCWVLKERYDELASQVEERAVELELSNEKLSHEIKVRKEVERAQRSHMHYLERIQRVIQAIGRSSDPEHWLINCVAAIREVFQADRAWLLYPCDPTAKHYTVPVEDTVNEYPGAQASGARLVMDSGAEGVINLALSSSAPVVQTRVTDKVLVEKFSIRSQMFMAVRPNIGKPWLLGLHQCEHETEWSRDEQRLFSEIGVRIEELLASVELHRELKAREERLRLLLESTEEGIYGIDEDGTCTFANAASVHLLGYPDATALVGKNMRQLTQFECPGAGPNSPPNCRECQIHKDGKGINWDGGYFSRADGGQFPVEFHCNPMPCSSDSQGGATVTFINISERKRYEKKIWHQANYDSLTGLPSRTLFMDRLSQAIKSAHRDERSIALMYIDLDRFKWVNDTLGHDAGDQLLVEAAQRLSRCARKSDTVARIGGDEFVVILPSIGSVRSAEQVAEKILTSFSLPYQIADRMDSFVSGSVGISLYPHDGDDADTLLKSADMAMYKAKEDGRNTFAFFTEEMSLAALEHMRVEQDLHHALSNGELELYYQPLMDLRFGKIVGAEALLRWNHPEHGIVFPGDFIPLAEETGLIFPIGDWVLQNVVQQLGSWQQRGLPSLKISINISARQCGSDGFIRGLSKALGESRVPAHELGLEMEITEGVMLEHVDEMIDRLQQVHDMGISLAVDDFGTGHTSLSGLKRFPVQSIKIAREFVQNAATCPKDAGLTRTIINMSHNLGMKVVAEGIETMDQLKFLREAGCHYGHGHYFCEALPANQFETFLNEAG
ncbi:EAL domain-containing protein [Pseudomonadota bacterium]